MSLQLRRHYQCCYGQDRQAYLENMGGELITFREEGYLTAEPVLLTEDEEERHQVPVKFAAHTSLSRLIALDGNLQLSSFLLVNAVQVAVRHI